MRNPLTVRDPELFAAVRGVLSSLTDEWAEAEAEANKAKARRRAQQAARLRTQAPPHAISPAPDVALPTEAEIAQGQVSG
jgi:hypothetical protein